MVQVAVYCSSSNRLDDIFYEAARELGRLLARAGVSVVFGGGDIGLMGVLARTAHEHGGHVVGVIPEKLREIEGVAYAVADDMIVTKTMSERKSIIWRRCDAFVVLAGGIGTLEEFLEVITLKKLGYHDRPVVLVNTDGVFDSLITQLRQLDDLGFSSQPSDELFEVVSSPGDLASLPDFQPFFHESRVL